MHQIMLAICLNYANINKYDDNLLEDGKYQQKCLPIKVNMFKRRIQKSARKRSQEFLTESYQIYHICKLSGFCLIAQVKLLDISSQGFTPDDLNMPITAHTKPVELLEITGDYFDVQYLIPLRSKHLFLHLPHVIHLLSL